MKKYNNKHIIFFVMGLFVFIAGGIYYFLKNSNSNLAFETINTAELEDEQQDLLSEEIETEDIEDIEENSEITVYITGAIKNSAVYLLESGSRIDDLVELSGGFTENVDLLKTNLAEEIFDGQHIHIYKIDEESISQVVETNKKTPTQEQKSELVNINTASEVELINIPGIGKVIAQSIIEYRESIGNFKSIEDIKSVNRIGDKTFENIKNFITVN